MLLKTLLTIAMILFSSQCKMLAATVTVFAAASLTESLKEIASTYEQETGDKIVFNFAASGTLARQIEAGAPADIFFSADESKADDLERKGLIVKGTRQSRLQNSLVIVAQPDVTNIHSPADLTNAAIQRIALGDVKTVPAGTYAQTYFEKCGLWSALGPKIIPCENVRAVLAAVESGNVDAGAVYKTDAAISKKVKVAFEVPVSDGPKISYPLALLANAPQPQAANKFLDYLWGNQARSVFLRYRFGVVTSNKAHE